MDHSQHEGMDDGGHGGMDMGPKCSMNVSFIPYPKWVVILASDSFDS
jgi:hypothetical protein